MTPADFEARYRMDPDPWAYTTSRYERAKYAATLAACGPGPFGLALELGSSIGVFSALLAPRCARLVTLEAAPTAVAAARRRLREHANVQVREGRIPGAIPQLRYDLVLASEILYYLPAPQLRATVARLEHVLAPGGRLVAVHWRPPGPERPFSARQVHEHLRALPWLRRRRCTLTSEYLLDVLERPAE